ALRPVTSCSFSVIHGLQREDSSMSFTFSGFLHRLRRSLGFGGGSRKRANRGPSRPASRNRPGLERLDDRLAPAVRWADTTPLGNSFTATGGTQPPSVGGLTPGLDLFPTIQ